MKQAPQELAPGATQQIEKMLQGQTVEAITVIKVPTEDSYAYQNIRITVKDGKVLYFSFVEEPVMTIETAINQATDQLDRYYYEHV